MPTDGCVHAQFTIGSRTPNPHPPIAMCHTSVVVGQHDSGDSGMMRAFNPAMASTKAFSALRKDGLYLLGEQRRKIVRCLVSQQVFDICQRHRATN
jgi:hypothetical protein